MHSQAGRAQLRGALSSTMGLQRTGDQRLRCSSVAQSAGRGSLGPRR